MSKADRETKDIIWKHLLTISAFVDPTGEARKILRDNTFRNDGNGGEADFLENIINKVEQNVDPNANPMEAVSSIMKSGVFTDLVQGMGNGLENGELDLGKLMGTVQKLVTNLAPPQGDGDSDESGPGAMMQTMLQNLKPDQDADPGQPPDLSKIINMVGPMMGAMTGGTGMPGFPGGIPQGESIEEQIDRQVKQAKEQS